MPMSRRERLDGLYLRYAIKFVADCSMRGLPVDAEPSDENLAIVLTGCARAPEPDEHEAIRRNVHAYRANPDTIGA